MLKPNPFHTEEEGPAAWVPPMTRDMREKHAVILPIRDEDRRREGVKERIGYIPTRTLARHRQFPERLRPGHVIAATQSPIITLWPQLITLALMTVGLMFATWILGSEVLPMEWLLLLWAGIFGTGAFLMLRRYVRWFSGDDKPSNRSSRSIWYISNVIIEERGGYITPITKNELDTNDITNIRAKARKPKFVWGGFDIGTIIVTSEKQGQADLVLRNISAFTQIKQLLTNLRTAEQRGEEDVVSELRGFREDFRSGGGPRGWSGGDDPSDLGPFRPPRPSRDRDRHPGRPVKLSPDQARRVQELLDDDWRHEDFLEMSLDTALLVATAAMNDEVTPGPNYHIPRRLAEAITQEHPELDRIDWDNDQLVGDSDPAITEQRPRRGFFGRGRDRRDRDRRDQGPDPRDMGPDPRDRDRRGRRGR